MNHHFYRSQTSFAKVMFLHVSAGGGGVQTQTQGEVGGSGWGVQAQACGGVYPSMHWGRHPPADGHWRHASYWNVFLLPIHSLIYMHRYDLSAFGPFLWNSVKKRSQYILSNYLSNAILHRQSLMGRRDDVSHDSKNFDLLFPQFSLKIGRFCVLWI